LLDKIAGCGRRKVEVEGAGADGAERFRVLAEPADTPTAAALTPSAGAEGAAPTAAARLPLEAVPGTVDVEVFRFRGWVAVELDACMSCDRGAAEGAAEGRASLLPTPVAAGAATATDDSADATETGFAPSRCLPLPLSPMLAPVAAAAALREVGWVGAGGSDRNSISLESEESETTRRFDSDLRFEGARFEDEDAVESASPPVSGSDARRLTPVVVWRRGFFDALPADVDGPAAVAGRDSAATSGCGVSRSTSERARCWGGEPTSLPFLALTAVVGGPS
jgi:hypothetical protein